MRLLRLAGIVVLLGVVWWYLDHQRTQERAQKRMQERIRVMRQLLARQQAETRRRAERCAQRRLRPPRVVARLQDLGLRCRSRDWAALLELADVYRTGEYPAFRPNSVMALQLYRVASCAPDAGLAATAERRYLECRQDPLGPEDVAGAPLPVHFGTDALDAMMVQQQPQPQPQPPTPPPPQQVVSDAQNVHDHAVTRGLKKALADMPGSKNAYEEVVMCVLESGATPEQKADALEVLDTLGTGTHSTMGVSERESLDRVWSKIHRDFDPETQRSARDILVTQLASGVEDGSVVCSTGKIARIMGTLDGLTDGPPVNKPMWAIREEIGTLAAKVRDLDGGNAETFRQEAMKTYVDDLGLSRSVVGKVVDEYALGF